MTKHEINFKLIHKKGLFHTSAFHMSKCTSRFCCYRGIILVNIISRPIPVVARSMAWVCGRSFAGIAGWNPAGSMVACPIINLACCQSEVPVFNWSPVQMSPTECGVPEWDRVAHWWLLRHGEEGEPTCQLCTNMQHKLSEVTWKSFLSFRQ